MKFIMLLKNCLFLIVLFSVGMTIITANPQQSKPNKASSTSTLESKSDREKLEAAQQAALGKKKKQREQQLLAQRAHDEKIRTYLTILAAATIIGSIAAGVWLLKDLPNNERPHEVNYHEVNHDNVPEIDAQPIRNWEYTEIQEDDPNYINPPYIFQKYYQN